MILPQILITGENKCRSNCLLILSFVITFVEKAGLRGQSIRSIFKLVKNCGAEQTLNTGFLGC